MDNGNGIYKALTAIQNEIGAIGKNKRSPGVTYAYRGIDDVMNELHPLLAEFGVTIVPEVMEQTRENRVTSKGTPMIYSIMKIRFHFYAIDGSEVMATVIGEGMDTGDKASNKAMAIAYKYACFQVFCIPTEEMAKADPDGYMPEPSTAVPTQAELKRYIDNCNTLEDIADLNAMWGNLIKADPMLAQYGNQAYQALKGGAQ